MSDPVLDTAAHDAIRSIGQPALLARVIALYREETPKQLAALRAAAAAGDAGLVLRASHTMKSSSRGVGGMRLGSRCAECEVHARAGRLADAVALVDDIEREFAALDAALVASIAAAVA